MKTKTINLYDYAELSPEAKKRAHQDWINDNDHPFLKEYLEERLAVFMDLHGIVPDDENAKLFYSLSHSQGDGVMFEGFFTWGTWNVRIKQNGHYYHENSKTIFMENEKGEEADKETYDEFDMVYVKICKELAKEGYEQTENDDSESSFIEACEANEYTFLSDGKMENA